MVKSVKGKSGHYSEHYNDTVSLIYLAILSLKYFAITFGSINSIQVEDQRCGPLLSRSTQSAEAGISGLNYRR